MKFLHEIIKYPNAELPYDIWVLPLGNGASTNTNVQVSVDILVLILLDEYLEVELLHHMEVSFLTSWGISILFFIVVAPFYIPTNSV